jgi:hypothetical protein
MTLNTYYVSWHTWLTQEITTPWDFWYLSRGTMPKAITQEDPPDPEQVWQVWQNPQDIKWGTTTQSPIWDVKLVTFVQAESTEKAQSQVTELFPDAVYDKCVWVDDDTKQQIEKLFLETLTRSS